MNESNFPAESAEENAPQQYVHKSPRISASSTFFLVLVSVTIAVLVTFSATLMLSRDLLGISEKTTLGKIVNKLMAIEQALDDEYVKEIDEETLIDSVLKGYMYGIGDNYADYYTQEEYASMMTDLSGKGVGIGVSVIYNSEYAAIEVVSVFPNSPAFEAGVQAGDLIAYLYVNGESVSVAEMGYEKALENMLGEAGSSAEFTVFRGAGYSEMVEFSIIRAEYTEATVMSHKYSLDETIGIIKITSFDNNTPTQFNEALNSLTSDGIRGIILDVRYNPGGELYSVCKTLDMLLPEGPVIRTVDKNGKEEVVYVSDENETNIPMVVLVNEGTASAGELFTAALRDYEKASIVGTVTYGKGSMQTTAPFNDGTGFKFTTRYYCPPFSDNYDGVGIVPDVIVELAEELQNVNIYKIEDSEDNQIAAAYEELLNNISK